jgi:hypothetical protein
MGNGQRAKGDTQCTACTACEMRAAQLSELSGLDGLRWAVGAHCNRRAETTHQVSTLIPLVPLGPSALQPSSTNSSQSGSAPPSRARCANRKGSALLRPSVGSARTCRRLLAIVKCNEKTTNEAACNSGRATRNVAVMRQRHTSQPAQPIAECGAARRGTAESNECPSAARRLEPSTSDAAASASRGSARLGGACVLQRGQPRATHGIGARPSARSVSPSTRPRGAVATACVRSIGITQSKGQVLTARTAVLCGMG